MPGKRWILWLVVFVALAVGGQGVGLLLGAQGLPRAGALLTSASLALALFWLLCGIHAFAQPRWLLWTLMYIGVVCIGAGLAWSFFRLAAPAVGLLALGAAAAARVGLVARAYGTRPNWRVAAATLVALLETAALCVASFLVGAAGTAIALGGIGAMTVLFLVGLWAIRFLLGTGHPVTGVARAVVDEAMRMKIVLVLIVLVMLIVPILPYAGGAEDAARPAELLKYRIGAFLAWSLWATAILLGLMTVFLSCWTIAGDVRYRQVYMTMTKPVSRAQYLQAKWLGICMLNLLLVAVAGAGIYTFARVMEQLPEARDAYDRQAVGEQVLTARVAVSPRLPEGQSLAQRIRERWSSVAPTPELLAAGSNPQAMAEELKRERSRWHTIAYLGSQTYVFSGLQRARQAARTVQLRIKPAADNDPDNGRIRFSMKINGRPYPVPELLLDQVHVLPIPSSAIDEGGRLTLQIINQHPFDKSRTHRTQLSFTPDEGLQLLYRYGGFGPNLVRGLAMVWLQLCFLAMLGLGAGTFLGFPVACLVSMVIYVTALLSSFLSDSLSYYAGVERAETWWDLITSYPAALWENLTKWEIWGAIKVIIRLIGESFVSLVPAFSTYNPIPLIADGQAVSYGLVGRTALMVGVVWTGVVALVAYAIFRRRELARVTV